MPSNIYGAVIMWERDDVHSEWLWKAELGYTKFGSMSIFFFKTTDFQTTWDTIVNLGKFLQ